MQSYTLGGWTFKVGARVTYDRMKYYTISHFKANSISDMVIYFTDGSKDFASYLIKHLDKGDVLLLPPIHKGQKKAVKKDDDCKKLKLQIATLQKKNDELTDALTSLAEKAMNAAGWRMKVDFKKEEAIYHV